MGQGRLTHIVTHTILTSFSTFSRGKIEKCDLFKEIKNETVAYSVLPKQQATLPPTAAGHCRNYKKLLLWLDVPSRSSWNSPPPRHMSVSRFQPLGTGQDAEECGPMICAAINKRGFPVRGILPIIKAKSVCGQAITAG